MGQNIIQEVLNKTPHLKKEAKTVTQRVSAIRSTQNKEKKWSEKRQTWDDTNTFFGRCRNRGRKEKLKQT